MYWNHSPLEAENTSRQSLVTLKNPTPLNPCLEKLITSNVRWYLMGNSSKLASLGKREVFESECSEHRRLSCSSLEVLNHPLGNTSTRMASTPYVG